MDVPQIRAGLEQIHVSAYGWASFLQRLPVLNADSRVPLRRRRESPALDQDQCHFLARINAQPLSWPYIVFG
jgi:hypothetical protein